MAGQLDRLRYQLSQRTRVALYSLAYIATQRVTGPTRKGADQPMPGREAIEAGLNDLFARDWANIEAGMYAKPQRLAVEPVRMFRQLTSYFQDLPDINRRRNEGEHSEVLSDELREDYPRYYLQNFHYQTDGWLSDHSAKLYDTQVDVLFTGTTDAMRRQALVPIAEALASRDQRQCALLDVGCGTARFLTDVCDNYPRLAVTGLDLSPNYLKEAAENLRSFGRVKLVEANAENMPVEDASQDIVTSIYLFHELPPKVRRTVAKEIHRVLKPGGTFVLVETLQLGDTPDFDALLEAFPHNFHEPYYAGYIREDLAGLFGDANLACQQETVCFLSKISTFKKV